MNRKKYLINCIDYEYEMWTIWWKISLVPCEKIFLRLNDDEEK
jgi:hypothetical protein